MPPRFFFNFSERFASFYRCASATAACFSGVRLCVFLAALADGVAGSVFFAERYFVRVFVSVISPTLIVKGVWWAGVVDFIFLEGGWVESFHFLESDLLFPPGDTYISGELIRFFLARSRNGKAS